MPYDRELDACVFSKTCETESDRITVGIYSYNNGQKKLQITRESKNNQGEFKFAKLGRMTKGEVDSVLPIIQEAHKNMD